MNHVSLCFGEQSKQFRVTATLFLVCFMGLSVVGAWGQTSPLVRPIVTDQTSLPLSDKFQPATGKLNQSRDFAFLSNDGYALFLRKAGEPAPVRIIQRGDPVPGVAESRIENIWRFFISNAGVVAFSGHFSTTDSSGEAIFLYDGTGLHTLLRSADVAPRSSGAVFGNMSLVGFNDSGDIAFVAAAGGTLVNTYFILPAGGTPTRVAGPGDSMPDVGGTIKGFSFAASSDKNALNALGEVVFLCGNSSNVWGIFAGSKSGLRKIVAAGDAKPGSGTFTALYPEIWINNSGAVVFRDTSYSSGKSITTLWRNTPGVGTVRVVADGDAAPSEVGGTLSSVKLQGLNDAGQVLFTATQGVFRTKADLAVETVAYAGQPIPGGSGDTFSAFAGPVMNDSGDVAFGANGATGAHVGVFEKSGTDPLKVLAFQGDTSGIGGGTLELLNFYHFTQALAHSILNDGSVYFPADVIGGSADFVHLLGTSSGLQILMSGADSLPDGARVNLGTVQSGAGDYVGFLASRNGGRRTAFVQNVLTGDITKVATSGDPAPGTAGRLRLEDGYIVLSGDGAQEFVNSQGQVALFSPIVGTPHPAPFDFAGICKGVFLFDSHKGLQKIAAAGEMEASTGWSIQGIYSDPIRRTGEHPLNSNGQVVFVALLSDGHSMNQSILVGSIDGGVKKVVSGDERLPGNNSVTAFYFSIWSNYQHSSTPQINDAGQVAFSSGEDYVDAIYLWSPGATPVKIAAVYDVLPSGEIIDVLSPFSLNENGQIVYSARLRNSNRTFLGSATFIGSAGNAPQPLLKDGDSVVGIEGSSVLHWFEGSSYDNWHSRYEMTYTAGLMNSAGTVVLPAQLTGGPADSGLFLRAGVSSSLTPVYLQGQSLPGTSGVFGAASPYYSGRVMLNDSGYVYVNNYRDSSTDSQGLFRYRPDGVVEKVLATGDTVPDSGGKVVSLGQIYQTPVSNLPFLATLVGGSASEAIYVPLPVTLETDVSSLSFKAEEGVKSEAQALTISDAGGNLSWTATASDSWINLDATSGRTPSTVGVSVNTSGLSQGVHHGTISVTSSLAHNSPKTIDITLKVQPAPVITWPTPEAITYGTALSATQLNATTPVPGTFTYNPTASTVLGAGTQTLSVTFTPTDADTYATVTRTVSLFVNKASSSVTWATPAAITYGTALSTVQLNATADRPGTFAYSPAAGTVPDAGTRTLAVTFTPTDTNYASSSGSVQLMVNKATPVLHWTPPVAIASGTALGNAQLNATADIPGAFVYTPSAGTLLAVGTQTLSVRFTPSDTSNYTDATATVPIKVQPVPVITWPVPVAITYGTALSATQLNATASVPGTFAYTPHAGVVLGAGTQTLSVTFTPTDADTYATATSTVSLIVNKAPSTVAWTTPAAVTYGTALSTVQLNATADVPGTFAYSPAAGTVPNAGTHTLTVSFTPADTTNYTAASGTVQLTVNKATPVVHWAAPAAITSGTALGDAQLNATADVPGTFVYTPAKGTVPEAGTQTLSVRFTPTDTGNYTEATASVSLKVNAPEILTPVITSLSPALVKAGSSAFSLVVSGTGFGSGAAVMWNGSARTTTAVSGGLQAEISAADIASSGTVNITVANPAGQGGAVSSRYQFVIDTAAAASSGFTVTAPTTVTVDPGKDTQVPITLSGITSGANVTATCLNAPAGVTCSYQNGVLTFTTSSSTPPGTYTITTVFSTTTQATAMRRSNQGYFALWLGLGGLPFGLIWAGGIRKTVGHCGIVVAGLLLLVALTSCGGGATTSNPPSGNPTTPTTPVTRQSSVVMTLTVR